MMATPEVRVNTTGSVYQERLSFRASDGEHVGVSIHRPTRIALECKRFPEKKPSGPFVTMEIKCDGTEFVAFLAEDATQLRSLAMAMAHEAKRLFDIADEVSPTCEFCGEAATFDRNGEPNCCSDAFAIWSGPIADNADTEEVTS
jgi:hypothetical protein